jgi:alpha/beta superfamily hydrolase
MTPATPSGQLATRLDSHEPNSAGSRNEAALLRNVELTGPAGRLEAVVNSGSPHAPFAALICHPHPRYGGNLHNKVVYHAMKAFNDPEWGLGWPVLRFNFRGTGLSQGQHDGKAETGDVRSALDWLEHEFKLPLIVAGFSFGAAMALLTCCGADHAPNQVSAVAALGLPTQADGREYRYSFLHNATLPKLFLSGDQDEFATAAQLEKVAASAADPKRLVLIPGADHFFTGQLEPMQQALAGWLKEQLP